MTGWTLVPAYSGSAEYLDSLDAVFALQGKHLACALLFDVIRPLRPRFYLHYRQRARLDDAWMARLTMRSSHKETR